MSSIPARSSISQLDYSILQQCIHCGLCLPTCPTYDATKHETSSPRGRIALMRALADGNLPADSRQFAAEMDFCLGCLACQSACPAGVNYAEMLEHGRAVNGGAWLLRWLFTKPARVRAVARLLRVDQRLGLTRALRPLMPARLRELHALQPRISRQFSDALIREVERPAGKIRYRVGLLTGCVQDVAFAEINRDTVDVLLANGCEVFTPRPQSCCGSVLGHNGELRLAGRLALQNAAAFKGVEVMIVNSAGCGSFMKHRPEYAGKVRDIFEFLDEIGLTPPGPLPVRVTYHDACHLAHGQKITRQPRDLLRAIPDLELVELTEATWCCGSAGIYNITQPEMSRQLLDRKLNRIAATGVSLVATANPGCLGQIANGARQRGLDLEIVHPLTLMARAYRATPESGVRI